MVNPVWLKDKKTPSPGELWKDLGLSVASGARSGLEAIPGFVGDVSELTDMGVGYGAEKLGYDPEKAIKGWQTLTPLAHWMPTTENVGAGSDWLVNQLPASVADQVQAVTRHEAQTPGGEFGNFMTQMAMDPELLGGGALVKKALGRDDLLKLMMQGGR